MFYNHPKIFLVLKYQCLAGNQITKQAKEKTNKNDP
jgi:hypothetical protein